MSEQAPVKKYSVFLPKTDFPMKADLPQREPKRLERWKALDSQGRNLYARIEAKRRTDNAAGLGKGREVLHDGPPYANGAIHMGHALNKILKDVVVKSRWMEGYESPYVPGWDCHGLPIEHAVEKDLGPKRRELSRAEFLQKCRAYAQKWIDTQRTAFQRLGVLGAWEQPYVTMDPRYEAETVRHLAKLFESGSVTRKLKVVHWSYGARTALAEAEVEYADKTSPAITVAFPVADAEARRLELPVPLFVPIWTTTPWTLPSNLAVAMHPDFEYAIVRAGERHYIVAVPLREDFAKKLGVELHTVEIRRGKEFQTLVARHPWIDRDSPVLLADYVTADTGTGLVHTAPDHGVDDFNLAHHLGLLQLVGPDGKFLPAVNDPELEGKNIFDANPLVVERLKNDGSLLHVDMLTHSYPHCWRTRTPILFRATEQWFITMDSELTGKGRSLRELGIEGVEQTQWIPAQGQNRISAMIAGRPDWCISRQRAWGTPITVLRCEACGEPLVAPSVFEAAALAIEQGGIEAWSELSVESLLPAGSTCRCGSQVFQKETDILDVWIDSGVSASVVCESHPELKRSDYGQFIYLEGSDQHRGWFHSSLLFNLAATGTKPYKQVVTHGWTARARRCPRAWAMSSRPRKSSRLWARTSCAGGPPAAITARTSASPRRSWTAALTPTGRSATPCASSWAPWRTSIPSRMPWPPQSWLPWTAGCWMPLAAPPRKLGTPTRASNSTAPPRPSTASASWNSRAGTSRSSRTASTATPWIPPGGGAAAPPAGSWPRASAPSWPRS